uniref:Uncharacterized protein n=1 Tax=Pygocentrus nattereri TaxID=42514 RepID=A0AAR2LKU9_PYGNA
SIIHPRSHSNDKSARLSIMMDDDIEKRVLVNKDGSLSMEMKVRFRLLNDETLHWSTEIKKSSGSVNESFMEYNDDYYLQHSNSESCSEAESLSEPHCQHCCTYCQEYDIWKNPVPGEQGPVQHIRSSSSSTSSHKIVCKKASVDSVHTMSSEEYTDISTKSKKFKVEEEKENGSNPERAEIGDKRVKSALSDHSKAPSSVKCVCDGSNKPQPPTETSTNEADNEERSASALSKKSAKSKTSSVGSNSEIDLTPASASVSIGIVEEYDADNTEEEHSVSVVSMTSVPPVKSESDDCCKGSSKMIDVASRLKPDERPQSSVSAGTNVSNKSKKSKCTHSNSAQPISDTECGIDDEVTSNTSATKNDMESKSDTSINTNSSVEQKYSTKEERSSSKVSSASHSKDIKSSSVSDRPKSNMSNASSHLEVKGQKSKSNSKSKNANIQAKRTNNSSNRPTKEDEKEPSRPRSADLCATSENRLSPSPLKSPNRSKKPVILLGGSNDSVTCNGPLDVTDYGRDVSDKTSEKSSKCRNRKGSSSSQQKVNDEISELAPSNLPNTSPTEVVNEWLNKIPLDSALYEVGDEFNENCKELETINRLGEPTQNEKENESEGDVDVAVHEPQIEKEAQMATEEMDNNDKEEVKNMTDKDLKKNQSCPENDEVPKSFHSSVQVMRILLSPKLDRCNSLPEVSTVYGQKLSTSARGLLDCLVNLQLIHFDPNDVNGKAEKYKDLMNMLQTLWLCDPSDRVTVTQKSKSSEQQSVDDELKAKSSSGVDVSSGSTGSGKSSVNDSTQAQKSQTNTEGEGPETLTKVQEVDEIETEMALEVVETKSDPATPDIASRVQWTPETEGTVEERIEDNNIPASDDTIRSNDSPREPLETPLSSNKSAGNEHQEETSSGTPPSVQRAPLTKRISQDPDPVWVLNLLNKLEKQFMTHYVNAMAEFKVRWNLDDNEQLDGMICELRDEVHKRIQSSIDRE